MRRWSPALLAALGLTGWAAAGDSKPNADELLISAQKICPISGRELGSMGSAVKTEIDGRVAFLCCDGCQGKAAVPEHWTAMRKHQARAQAICPVMKSELPEDAASIVVEKREVFVCCPPCTKKIKAAPEKYLNVVDSRLADSRRAAAESE